MGPAEQLDALERSVEGTLAQESLEFDGDDQVLRINGSLVSAAAAFLFLLVVAVALLFTGAILSFTGPQATAQWTLASGAALFVGLLAFHLLMRYVPVPFLRRDLEVRLAERALVHRRSRVPFGDLRPEHLVWRKGPVFRRLYVRHPSLRTQITRFFGSEASQAEEFERRLWALIHPSAHDDGGLTPVQRWIIGAGAPYGAINGFQVDRLGPAPGADATAADRRTAQELLHDPWNAYDLEHLLGALNWLVQDGHRADFTQDADRATRSPAAQDEYETLLREVDELIARDRLESPFVERLIELVRVRYGAEGEEYARLVPPLLRDDPGADASPEGAELALFLRQLFNDRSHAAEELHRLKALADPALRANLGRFLIWDYGRALMLYRWGHMVGWLTEEYCWERMLPLALDIQRRYTSWQDMATCYVQARRLWSGGDAETQRRYERLIDDLSAEPHSPWNLVPWDLDLTRDWPLG